MHDLSADGFINILITNINQAFCVLLTLEKNIKSYGLSSRKIEKNVQDNIKLMGNPSQPDFWVIPISYVTKINPDKTTTLGKKNNSLWCIEGLQYILDNSW